MKKEQLISELQCLRRQVTELEESKAEHKCSNDAQDEKALYSAQKSNVELQQRVAERTQELVIANRTLQAEITDRRRTEEALRESEGKFRDLAEKSFVGIYLLQDGVFRYVNSRIAEIFGSTIDEMLDKLGPKDVILPEDLPLVEESMRKRLSGELESAHYGFKICTKSGEIRHVEVYSTRTMYQGKPAIIGTLLDVTERKQTENTLRESEELYRTLIETSPDPILMYSLSGEILAASSQAAKVYGVLSVTELLKEVKTIFDLLTEDGKTFAVENFQRTLIEGHSQKNEYLVRICDGRIIPMEVNSSVVRTTNGEPRAFISVVRDITARKQAEEALRLSEAKFRALAESSSTAIFLIQGTKYIYVNPAFERITGYTIDDLAGMNFWDFIHPDFQELVRSRGLSRLDGEKPPSRYEIKFITKDGHEKWADFSATIIEIEKNPTIIGSTFDITERKHAEEEMRFRTEELVALNRLARVLTVQSTLEEVERTAVKEITAALGTDLAIIFEHKGGVLHLKASTPATLSNHFETAAIHRVGECLCGLVAQTGQSIYCINIENDSYCTWEECKTAGLRSFAAVPLLLGDVLVGVLGIASIKERNFEKVARFLETASDHIAISISNVQMYDKTRMYATQLEEQIAERKKADMKVRAAYEQLTAAEGQLRAQYQHLLESEKAVRKSEKEYRSVIENIQDVFYRSDINGQLIMASPSGAKMFGYGTIDEMIGMPLDSFWPDPKERGRLLEQIKRTGSAKDIEAILKKKDGTTFNASLTTHFYFDESGKFLGTEGIIRDISERKRVEAELQRSEEKYRGIFENAVEGIYQSTPDGHFLSVNPAYAGMYGYASPQEMMGNITEIDQQLYVNPEDRKTFKEILEKNGIIKGFEAQHYKKGGDKIWVQVNAILVNDSTGKILYNGFAEDITKQKIAENEREALMKQLHQAQKMEAIGTLAGGIAHDFNNILGAILGYTDMALTNHKVDDRLRGYLDQIYKAGERARDLVKQILAFSRQSDEKPRPLRISPIIKEVLKLLRASLPSTIQIHQNVKSDSDTVLADPTQIHQILMNLCSNAAYAMRERKGELKVSLSPVKIMPNSNLVIHHGITPGMYLTLMVSDSGVGIAPDIMDRIFDPFFTTKKPGEGTGMGLSVVYGIIKGYGGTITVKSEVGRGTEFFVYLPLLMETVGEEEIKGAKAIAGGNERILFVDDEEPLVQLGKEMLTKLGYEVVARVSSLEAREAFRSQPDRFDLVITDMTMPNMTGVELAIELMRIRSNIPIILCTGFSETISSEKAKRLGIRQFIMKPLLKHQIAVAIRHALDHKE